jgi:hypothetical protein
MRERMIADVIIIGASVSTGLDRRPRRSDHTADTEVSENVNTTVIAERIDAEGMIATAEVILLDLVETTETVTAPAMVNEIAVMTAVTTEKEGTPTPVNLETETRVPIATVIRTTSARDPHDVPLSYTRTRAVTTVAMETDETTPAETTIIATTHTTETVGHLLPVLRPISQTPNSKRRSAFANLQRCNRMQTSLSQNAASGLLSLLPKNKSRRRRMISNVLIGVNSCPRYISVCRKIAWMNAFGAVEVDCPRWRRIKDF